MITTELCLSHPCIEVSVWEIDGIDEYIDEKVRNKCIMSKRFERYDNVWLYYVWWRSDKVSQENQRISPW